MSAHIHRSTEASLACADAKGSCERRPSTHQTYLSEPRSAVHSGGDAVHQTAGQVATAMSTTEHSHRTMSAPSDRPSSTADLRAGARLGTWTSRNVGRHTQLTGRQQPSSHGSERDCEACHVYFVRQRCRDVQQPMGTLPVQPPVTPDTMHPPLPALSLLGAPPSDHWQDMQRAVPRLLMQDCEPRTRRFDRWRSECRLPIALPDRGQLREDDHG